MGNIKKMKTKEFKKACIDEMNAALKYLDEQTKNDEDLTAEDAEEAKEIMTFNINRLLKLSGGEPMSNDYQY